MKKIINKPTKEKMYSGISVDELEVATRELTKLGLISTAKFLNSVLISVNEEDSFKNLSALKNERKDIDITLSRIKRSIKYHRKMYEFSLSINRGHYHTIYFPSIDCVTPYKVLLSLRHFFALSKKMKSERLALDLKIIELTTITTKAYLENKGDE